MIEKQIENKLTMAVKNNGGATGCCGNLATGYMSLTIRSRLEG